MSGRAKVGKRHLAKVHFRTAKDLKAVKDAAKARELSLSGFMSRVAMEAAHEVNEARRLAKAS